MHFLCVSCNLHASGILPSLLLLELKNKYWCKFKDFVQVVGDMYLNGSEFSFTPLICPGGGGLLLCKVWSILDVAVVTVWPWIVTTTWMWTVMPIWITLTLSVFLLSRTGMCVCMCMWAYVCGGNWQGKTKVLKGKPFSLPLFPSGIPHGLSWNWTWMYLVRSQQIISWAMRCLCC